VREIRPLVRCGGGWKPAHGSDSEGTPNGNGEQWIGRTYGAMAPVLDPTAIPEVSVACFTATTTWLLFEC
jgi:hypothetical protein